MNRRTFIQALALSGIGSVLVAESFARGFVGLFDRLASPEYSGIEHSSVDWKPLGKELDFGQIDVYKEKKHIDRVSLVRFNPKHNQIRVFNSFRDSKVGNAYTIEEWQRKTSASVLINSAQYMADPFWYPCALMVCDGKRVGPTKNKAVSGMLVAEPKNEERKASLLDFRYDSNNFSDYQQGVQHWPILLDRSGEIRVGKSDWQANRTAVAECRDGSMLFLTTEGGFFTLHNLGRFLKEANLEIKTAMPMDGGYEAEMLVRTDGFSYTTYGQFETQGRRFDISIPNARCPIPSVIGVFPR